MKSLKVDLAKSIFRFEYAMKKRFLIKNIFYERVFRGKGLEFDGFRPYNYCDDASLIDWKATMKLNSPLVRQYVEERDLKILFIIDVGDNMVFGSGDKLKNELSAEISASLGHLLISLGDTIGFVLYSDKIKQMRLFSKGMRQFYIFQNSLLNPENYGEASNLKNVLKTVAHYLKKVSSVFIISDFINLEDSEEELKKFITRFETIGIMVRDPIDLELPDLKKEVIIEDPQTGRQMLINPGVIRYQYKKYAMEQKKKVEKLFKDKNSDLIDIYTNEDFVKPLSEFLKSRIKSRRYIMPKR